MKRTDISDNTQKLLTVKQVLNSVVLRNAN